MSTALQDLGYDLEGWGEVATYFSRSVRTVQRWASRGEDPLPIKKLESRVVAKSSTLKEWAGRNVTAADAA